MSEAETMKLSTYHRTNHTASLKLAQGCRNNGAKHAQLMELARVARFYFEQLRKVGE
jgi:hypothetical protein